MPVLNDACFQGILLALERKTGFAPRGRDCRCPCPGHSHDDASPSGRVWVENGRVNVHCYRGHKWEEWAANLDVPRCFWFLKVTDEYRGWAPKAVEIVARYTYRRSDGSEAYQVVRTNPKGFWQERPYRLDTGAEVRLHGLKGGWYSLDRGLWRYHHAKDPPRDCTNAVYAEDAVRVLYRLPELEAAALEEPVYFVEGEKDCDLARQLGCVATTTAQGAANFYPGVCRPLRERHVVVIPDNDQAGYKHAACVAGAAVMCGAASVRVAFWRKGEVGPGGDFGDWFSANDWPDADDVRRRFYQASQPFGVLPTTADGDVIPRGV